MATSAAHRAEWEAFLKANHYQQFGQADDETTFDGATGCTHTDLQKLVQAKTGRLYSHDEISKIAGYPVAARNPRRRGMRWSMNLDCEVMRVVRHFGLPYEPYFHDGPLTTAVWNKVKVACQRGPVMTAVKYSHWPERRGTTYNGVAADGKPNGFASRNGKTQLAGAESIAHAVLWVAYWQTTGGWAVDAFDPNHGSAARPERPAFDRFTTRQLQVAISSIRLLKVLVAGQSRSRSLAFLVPTRTFTPR